MNPTQALAEFAAGVDPAGLDPDVERRARELLLDHLGVLLRGTAEPVGAAARAWARRQAQPGPCWVAPDHRAGAATAALANGIAAHAIELDDVTNESSLHPGVAVWPAALAVVERDSGTLGDALAAAVAGYEVSMRIGDALGAPAAYARGFHPTGVAGVFGAAAAAARARGAATINHALGLAGSMAAGSMAYLQNGSDGKRVNAGWAAHGGVVAADLAVAGFTGPDDVAAGRFGALGAYSDAAEAARLALDPAGRPAMLDVAIKPYACCRYIHPVIDACLDLRGQIGDDARALTSIEVSVLPGGDEMIAEPADLKRRPRGRVDAQFSVYHAAAVALLHGDVGPDKFDDPYLTDPAVRALAARVTARHDAGFDRRYPQRWGSRVQADTAGGARFEATVDDPRGDRRRPLSQGELRAKFVSLAEPVAGRAVEGLAERVLRMPLDVALSQVLLMDRTSA